MITLPKLSEQPPRGTIPASDLIEGDVIEADGYPADLVQIIRRNGTVVLYWGWDIDDGMIVSATTMIDVVGYFQDNTHV